MAMRTDSMVLFKMKIDWITFWIAALATYRLTVFVARDRGPFEVFKKIRSLPYLGTWAKCPFCVSPYAASLVCFGLWVSGYCEAWPMWILVALAMSAVTIALDRTFSSDVTN